MNHRRHPCNSAALLCLAYSKVLRLRWCESPVRAKIVLVKVQPCAGATMP